MNFKKWVRGIQTAGYNDAGTVFQTWVLQATAGRKIQFKQRKGIAKYAQIIIVSVWIRTYNLRTRKKKPKFLILEPWITPSIFEEVNVGENKLKIVDEYTYAQYVDKEFAKTRLDRYKNWITL